jgi:hypothetical protein
MKKKVIALTIDTTLTNDQLEESATQLQLVCRDTAGEDEGLVHEARNVRVLDSDEIHAPAPAPQGDIAAIKEALALMNSMICCGEKHSGKSDAALGAARAAVARLSGR